MEENHPPVQSESRFYNFCSRFDIFSFLPVPTSRELSTQRSVIGSIILILFFLGYVIYGIYKFTTNNPPRTNQYFMPIPDLLEIQSPEFAIIFMTGENLNISFYNESYFSFKLQQVTIYTDIDIPRKYEDIKLEVCSLKQISWIRQTNFTNLLCNENNSHLKMQGLIYSSEVHKFPRIQVSICENQTNQTINCATETEIFDILSKGRLFFFIAKPGGMNFATEAQTSESFTLLYYFMVPGFYNRAELSIRKSNYIVRPDYLTTFTTNQFSTLDQVNEKIYMSKTPDPSLLFLIWMRLDQSEEFDEIVYITLIDSISLWGALWSVLFTLFAFYFLKHNRTRFYEKKPEWNEFDEEFEKLKKKKREEYVKLSKSPSRGKSEESGEEEKKEKENLGELGRKLI